MSEKEDYVRTYICTLGYWSPYMDERKDIDIALKKNNLSEFERKFNEALKNDLIDTIQNMHIFENVKLKFQDTKRTNQYLDDYRLDDVMNYIYFKDIIIECNLDPERYQAMIKKNGDDKRIVEKLRNKIDNALFESDFRNLRIEINLNTVREFQNNYETI